MSDTGVSFFAASGIVFFSAITGLQPELLIAGAAGGYWSISYQPAMSAFSRINRIILSSLVAAWLAPLVVFLLAKNSVDLPAMTKFPMALVIGLITIDVLGKSLMIIAKGLLSRIGKTRQEEA